MENLNYGIIGNCRTAALISEKGSIDWLCFPDFDSESIFSKIIDEGKGGSFGFRIGPGYTIRQSYLENTNILSTKFESPAGGFEVVDFMPRYRTPENSYYIPAEIYRFLRPLYGTPKLSVLYDPKMNYAKENVVHTQQGNYLKTESVSNEKNTVYLYSDVAPDLILDSREFELKEECFFLFSYNQKLIPIDLDRVKLEYQRTKIYWLNWNNRSKKHSLYNKIISRSLLVLKLMSYQPTGAVLAAVTTSLPETIGGERNWDYRFCWLRDASMSIETLLNMGHQGAAQRFMNFIKRILKSKYDTFQIMYGIRGERILKESILPHLDGYKGSRPVRRGNGAFSQKQNDTLGYLMDVIYKYYMYFPGTLDEIEDMWEIVKNIVRTIISEWRNPDQGIWEFRAHERHFVFSKVMCWVALDRAIRISSLLGKEMYEEEWKEEADRIKKDVFENGWKAGINSFSQAYDNEELDSSLLLMEYYGFIDPSDERYVNTVLAIKKNLMNDGLLYRYRSQDGFGIPSSAFIICSFWMIRALFEIGMKKESLEMFESIVKHSNHLGLFSEDMDFKTKNLLGNFPQAYSHLALINTASLFSNEISHSKFIKP